MKNKKNRTLKFNIFHCTQVIKKPTKTPFAGFKYQTLGAASSDVDHYTMPLPPTVAVFKTKIHCVV